MPSPFPGMDPYLESPEFWRGFHQIFLATLTASLNSQLPEGYAANIDERLYVVQTFQTLYPDIAVLQRPAPRPVPVSAYAHTATGTAVAERLEDRPLTLTLAEEQERETFIEIFTVGAAGRPREVVTVIELLSPANKRTGEGRDHYQAKQRTLLDSPAHLLEIDLLRAGRHMVAVPEAALQEQGVLWDYLVCLHRGGAGRTYEYWPLSLRRPLPQVRVPLAEGSPDLLIDLQAAFTLSYDAGPYARFLDYRESPVPPLGDDNAAWADAVLQEQKRRP